MKKLCVIAILTLSCCIILPTAIHAQSNQNNTSTTMKKDCVKMKDGKVMQMKNGQSMPLTSDITLKDGKKVSSDGTVTNKDGKTWKLKEGDSIDMNGMVKKGSMHKSGASNQ